MKRYVYYQPNKKDLKDKCGDCTLRALTKFLGIEWVEAYDILSKYARISQTMPNDIRNIKEALKDLGYEYRSVATAKMKVKEIAKTFDKDTIVYCRAGYGTHLVATSCGQYFDTWDSGEKLAYGVWTK